MSSSCGAYSLPILRSPSQRENCRSLTWTRGGARITFRGTVRRGGYVRCEEARSPGGGDSGRSPRAPGPPALCAAQSPARARPRPSRAPPPAAACIFNRVACEASAPLAAPHANLNFVCRRCLHLLGLSLCCKQPHTYLHYIHANIVFDILKMHTSIMFLFSFSKVFLFLNHLNAAVLCTKTYH